MRGKLQVKPRNLSYDDDVFVPGHRRPSDVHVSPCWHDHVALGFTFWTPCISRTTAALLILWTEDRDECALRP